MKKKLMYIQIVFTLFEFYKELVKFNETIKKNYATM